MSVILSSLTTVEQQIQHLKDLVIEYHFANQQTNLERYMPSIIAIVAIIAGVFGPRYSFTLQERKEKKVQLARLYAEFSHNGREFAINFVKFNRLHLLTSINQMLSSHYQKIIDEQHKNGVLPSQGLIIKQATKADVANKLVGMLLEEDRTTKDFRFRAIKALFEIQFLTGDSKLDELITKFEKIQIYFFDPEKVLKVEEIEKDSFIDGIMKLNVVPTAQKLDFFTKEIQVYIKTIKT